jgi:RecA-family ATPase
LTKVSSFGTFQQETTVVVSIRLDRGKAEVNVAPLRPEAEPPSRPPPINVEAEQFLLGAIFRNNLAHSRVSNFLEPEHFSNAVHGRIYAAIGKLIERGQLANPVTLKNLFDQDGALAEIGGSAYLTRLALSAVTILNAEDYGRKIVDLAQRRRLIDIGYELAERAQACDLDIPAPSLIMAAAAQLQEVDHFAGASAALDLTVASSLASSPPPIRPWLVEDWIPRRQVTLLSGDGGVGKSLLAMHLQLAAASGGQWLGLPIMPCRSFGLYAEDEDDELHYRLWRIAEVAGVDVGSLRNMAWHSAAADAAELVEVDERGAIRPTAYYRQVERAILAFGARLVVLDATTNLFGGDEIKRRQVNQFIGLLRQLAIKIDGAVVLLAHPSVQGISSGSGLSGSTHWNNAVRSRLYLERAKGDGADPDERTLSRLKANYAAAGQVLRVRWHNGGFIPIDAPTGIDRAAVSAKADRVFLALLSKHYAMGAWTCPNLSARNYAPSVFAKHPDRDGLGKPAFEAAMHRLLTTGQIKIEKYGRPAEPHFRLALA